MTCAICGKPILHGSNILPTSESGCHDGVWMDDDEHFEGWHRDVIYPPCRNNPACCKACGGDGMSKLPIDQRESDDCEYCGGNGWIGDPQWPNEIEPKQLLAWTARTGDDANEDAAMIIFAVTVQGASETAAEQVGVDDLALTIERTPWADKYAPGPIPKVDMIDQGWLFECAQCGVELSAASVDEKDYEPVERNNDIWCDIACRDQYDVDQDMFRRIRAFTIDYLELDLLRVCPGAAVIKKGDHAPSVHVIKENGGYKVESARIWFDFPGRKLSPGWLGFYRSNEFTKMEIVEGDEPAFKRWRLAGYPSEMPDQIEASE